MQDFILSNDGVDAPALFIAVQSKDTPDYQLAEELHELHELARTAGYLIGKTITQKLHAPHPATYLGKGKLLEAVASLMPDTPAVIINDELTPSQLKHLEAEFKRPIIDRTYLILLIFERNARSSDAKAQVQLAKLQYLLPRLTRLWTHLDRQRGAGGTNAARGTGETQIEMDKRIIKTQITRLKKQLASNDHRRQHLTHKNRGGLSKVALIGYTNAGKSTLINRLAKSDLLAENKLFATLDTTLRKAAIFDKQLLIADTVGFIQKLPTHLVTSFYSTLNEVTTADLLLHVIDASTPNYQAQEETTTQTVSKLFEEAGRSLPPIIRVLNKCDLLYSSDNATGEEENEDMDFDFDETLFREEMEAGNDSEKDGACEERDSVGEEKDTPQSENHPARLMHDEPSRKKEKSNPLELLKGVFSGKNQIPTVYISAHTGEGIDELKETIHQALFPIKPPF